MNSVLKKVNQRYYPQKYFYSPEWIVLGVNNVCNLHCKMCDVGTNNLESNFAVNLVGTKPLNMPLDLLTNIMDQTATYYPKAKIGYAFTEPLVYPHLIESLTYAKTKSLYTSITTNALVLKQKATLLCDAKLDDLFISLDGPEKIHNEIRGHQKSFQKAVEGIEELLKHSNTPKISIFCVITEWNIGYLNEFIDFFKDYPIERIGFMHTNFTTKEMAHQHNLLFGNQYPATDSNIDEINVENMNLDTLWEEIREVKARKEKFPLSFSPEIYSKDDLLNFYHHPTKKMGKICNDIFTNIMIKSDGTVIPAHGRCYNLTIGNMHDQTLEEIWKSSILSNFRVKLMQNGGLMPACYRCCSAFS